MNFRLERVRVKLLSLPLSAKYSPTECERANQANPEELVGQCIPNCHLRVTSSAAIKRRFHTRTHVRDNELFLLVLFFVI